MHLLVSNANNRYKRLASKRPMPPKPEKFLGDFLGPRCTKARDHTPIWAADNDAFSGFSPKKYLKMLDLIAKAKKPPAFVTAPDVVCDHFASVDLLLRWLPELQQRNLPIGFVLQNGCEAAWDYHISRGEWFPWDEVDCFFIGGDTPFKFSPFIQKFTAFASCEKWIHMGRVNSVKRLRYAMRIGCHSCDGSGMACFTNSVLLPMIIASQDKTQPELKLY
jgi:hypothetical protein